MEHTSGEFDDDIRESFRGFKCIRDSLKTFNHSHSYEW